MIYHIVKESEYLPVAQEKQYVPVNFAQFGFVHCAFDSSVIAVANDYFADCSSRLLLLAINPTKLTSPTRYESAIPEDGAGTEHLKTSAIFPHIYGPIDNAAIEGIGILNRGENGYEWPQQFLSRDEISLG